MPAVCVFGTVIETRYTPPSEESETDPVKVSVASVERAMVALWLLPTALTRVFWMLLEYWSLA